MERIFAGIVLYNPDLNRLKENVAHIYNQVEKIILVNNGSKNSEEIRQYVKELGNCMLIDLVENKGIAVALNLIANKALEYGVNWILTLDQDTVCDDHIIINYRKYLNLENIGQLSCMYTDRNFADNKNLTTYDGVKDVKWCITSASLVNLSAWKAVGGFDENLFIDEVDYDICFSMREKGYNIYQAGFIGFIHEIGQGKTLKFAGISIKTWNHSSIRRYYGVRNAIIVACKHKELNTGIAILGAIKHILIIFVFEGDRLSKLSAGIKGFVDGIREGLMYNEN